MQTDPLSIRARDLRRNSTAAERTLWRRLCNRQIDGVKFRRQEPIGSFVADFVSLDPKLVIEIDGADHATTEARDRHRTDQLQTLGFRVLRFWNNEVLQNIDGVIFAIRAALSGKS